MRYLSTRGKTRPMDFEHAVLTGLAPDGGLLLPERIPDMRGHFAMPIDYVDFCAQLTGHFAPDQRDLLALFRESYGGFDCAGTVEFRDLGELCVLELFHGPTLAFKDIALQFLGRLFEKLLKRSGEQLNILGATSGDTGSAAIHAISGREGMRVFILYPRGRVSRLQEQQMICVDSPNVSCLSVAGSFDDCQRLVKTLFADLPFKRATKLGAVNSVNWARILAQTVYYGYAALVRGRGAPIVAVVPTGNFGNIFSGYLAMRMGFPIARLVLATNENDILSTFFHSGNYQLGEVRRTESPSMDIQSASNLERFLYYLFDEDGDRVAAFMNNFRDTGSARLEGRHRDHLGDAIRGVRVSGDEMRTAIRETYQAHDYILDPHSAVGVAAARKLAPEFTRSGIVCMATAHPAKFPETIRAVTGRDVTHPRLQAFAKLRGSATEMAVDIDVLKDHIISHSQ